MTATRLATAMPALCLAASALALGVLFAGEARRERRRAARHAEQAARPHSASTITDDALDALYARLEAAEETGMRFLAQQQEMAKERYAWQQRGDRAEAELARLHDTDSADAAAGSYAHRAEQAEAAIERARKLHRPADWHGIAICAECSALDPDSSSTDNPAVAYDRCATIAALTEPKEPTS